MTAAYIKEKWPELGPTVAALADVERGEEYEQTKVGMMSWWMFNILRAWFKGLGKSEKQ